MYKLNKASYYHQVYVTGWRSGTVVAHQTIGSGSKPCRVENFLTYFPGRRVLPAAAIWVRVGVCRATGGGLGYRRDQPSAAASSAVCQGSAREHRNQPAGSGSRTVFSTLLSLSFLIRCDYCTTIELRLPYSLICVLKRSK